MNFIYIHFPRDDSLESFWGFLIQCLNIKTFHALVKDTNFSPMVSCCAVEWKCNWFCLFFSVLCLCKWKNVHQLKELRTKGKTKLEKEWNQSNVWVAMSHRNLKCLWQEPRRKSTPHWVELGCFFSTLAKFVMCLTCVLLLLCLPWIKARFSLFQVSWRLSWAECQWSMSESLQICFLGFKSVGFEFYLPCFWLWKEWRAWKLLYTCVLLRLYIPASDFLNPLWGNHKWTKL